MRLDQQPHAPALCKPCEAYHPSWQHISCVDSQLLSHSPPYLHYNNSTAPLGVSRLWILYWFRSVRFWSYHSVEPRSMMNQFTMVLVISDSRAIGKVIQYPQHLTSVSLRSVTCPSQAILLTRCSYCTKCSQPDSHKQFPDTNQVVWTS